MGEKSVSGKHNLERNGSVKASDVIIKGLKTNDVYR